MKDLYETLGVSRDATVDQIRKAYRAKAKTTHPDAGGVREHFEELALAHTVLSDEEKRRVYDTTGFIKGEDDIRLEALDLMFQLATAAVVENPFVDVLYAVKTALARSRKELVEKSSRLERGAAAVRKSWTGAEEVRDYITLGFDRTRAQLEQRSKVYDSCWEMLEGAKFAGKQTSLADVFGRAGSFPVR